MFSKFIFYCGLALVFRDVTAVVPGSIGIGGLFSSKRAIAVATVIVLLL